MGGSGNSGIVIIDDLLGFSCGDTFRAGGILGVGIGGIFYCLSLSIIVGFEDELSLELGANYGFKLAC